MSAAAETANGSAGLVLQHRDALVHIGQGRHLGGDGAGAVGESRLISTLATASGTWSNPPRSPNS
jgi:hypothetical protein